MADQPFRVSSGLKDLIGQGLITDDYVAIFELVKNSFDAHACSVQIVFLDNKIIIADDGKGMSRNDINEKWLFVAYSAKRDGTEDRDYRHKLGRSKKTIYAGSKGVGRFSCDRLGEKLTLYSRAQSHAVQVLKVDWTQYEEDSKNEFGNIGVALSHKSNFPDSVERYTSPVGTVLEIEGLRTNWTRDKLIRLRRELGKLINPFQSKSRKFRITIDAHSEKAQDQEVRKAARQRPSDETQEIVNGPIENDILDVLRQKTTTITVDISNENVLTTCLVDRGELIYEMREESTYSGLAAANFEAELYYLNRSAKAVFARRMGIPSVEFGSIFLFRNGFRVFPIGNQGDDFFSLSHRQQQGFRRYLGSRDLIGRVQIDGDAGFEETTSRDGLIKSRQVDELIDCVRRKCVRRLERYVVDITWKDKYDKDQSDSSRMRLDSSSALITKLVSSLAGTKGLKLVSYNPDLVRIVDEKSSNFETSLRALEILAEATGEKALIQRVEQAKRRIKELEAAEADALAARDEARKRAKDLKTEVKHVEERNRFLVASSSLDDDTILNLHHQILMLASDVQTGVRRMMRKMNRKSSVSKEEWVNFLEQTSFRNNQIITAARFATKGGFRHQSGEIDDDLGVYFADYVLNVSSIWAPQGLTLTVDKAKDSFRRKFRPINIGIIIDNLVTNASRAGASKVHFLITVRKRPHHELSVEVADDGKGWEDAINPLSRLLEKGVTTTNGSGLGLHHIKQVAEDLNGQVQLHAESYSDELTGAYLTISFPL